MNMGAQAGRGGGAGDGPPENQLISARRDNPNGPEREKNFVTIDVAKETLSLRKGQRISRPERLVSSEWKTSEKVTRKKSVV